MIQNLSIFMKIVQTDGHFNYLAFQLTQLLDFNF